MFDCEGHDTPNGDHIIVTIGCHDGTTYEYIKNEEGLTTKECFEFLLKERSKAINVWFSFGYDVNKILHDIDLKGEHASLEVL